MARMDSPRRSSNEFIQEFSRMLIDRDKDFRAKLDDSAEQQEREHQDALAEALLLHEKVRETACHVLEAHHQLERLQREEAERRTRLEADEVLRKQQRRAAQLRLEEDEKNAQHQREQQKIRDRQIEVDKERRAREAKIAEDKRTRAAQLEAESKAKDAEAAIASQRNHAPNGIASRTTSSPFQPTPSPPTKSISTPAQTATPQHFADASIVSPLTTSIAQRDNEHATYIRLHKHLKEMRKFMKKASREKGSPIKDLDAQRREITKLFGQLANGAEDPKISKENHARRLKMVEILNAAKGAPGPTLDARQFIINPKSDLSSLRESECQVSGAFIYLFNFCAKAGVQQMKNAANNTSYNSAEPLGVSLALIFGHQNLRWRNESFIDIILAKLHCKCPILFGIYGSEKTNNGRARLGWTRDAASATGFVDDQIHYGEMAGMAMGWAALTLRDFKKSKSATNSCPPWYYWRSIACLVNTPPAETTPTHFVILKGLLENYADKFTTFYGQAATVAMRKAVVEFPETNAGNAAGNMVQGLKLLREIFRKKWGIEL